MAILQHSSNSDEKLAHAYGEVVELLERDALQYFKDKLYAKELSDRENSQHEGLGETITVSEVRRRKAIEASRSAIDDRSDIEDLSAFATKSKKINQEGVTAARTTTALSSSIPEYTDSHRSQEKMEYVE